MKHLIIGTAGHIDHGKSTLVKALTGIDPDRLKEEKERGITIDLGFAHRELGEFAVSFIDVPGHERFVKNMLAGVGGIHVMLLVVAADESVMPQTVEHFQICRLLGIRHAVVAVTKCDLVTDDFVEIVRSEVADLLAGSPLRDAPVVAVDAVSGRGLAELEQALLEELRRVDLSLLEHLAQAHHFVLPVDRAFTVRGFGTVVTGTAISGRLERGATVFLLPEGLPCAVRNLQVHGRPVDHLEAGMRGALNLQGVPLDRVHRGAVVTDSPELQPVPGFLAHLETVPAAPALRTGSPVHLHLGSFETIATCRLLDPEELNRTGAGVVHFELRQPAICTAGTRFIIRRFSPVETIGGGVVILPGAPKPQRKRRARLLAEAHRLLDYLRDAYHQREGEFLELLVHSRGIAGLPLAEAVAVTGLRRERLHELVQETPSLLPAGTHPPTLVSRAAVENLAAAARELLEDFHRLNPLLPGMARKAFLEKLAPALPGSLGEVVFQRLVALGAIEVDGAVVRLPGRTRRLEPRHVAARERILEWLQQEWPTRVDLADWARRLDLGENELRSLLRIMAEAGDVLRINEDWFLPPSQLEALVHRLHQRFPPGTRATVTELKELFGLTRKLLIPLLEFLDRRRITRREGETRLVLPPPAELVEDGAQTRGKVSVE
ncbi:MAG: selenocysteine-specific translation elongation factor [Acidobacteriota bacterium]